jgi:CRP/FNR family transcriptional regulator
MHPFQLPQTRRALSPATAISHFNETPLQLFHKAQALQAPGRQAARAAIDALLLIERALPVQRRLVHEGDALYRQGDRFDQIYVVNTGVLKLVNRSSDGRERITGFRFKGDWVGMDGMWTGQHECDAVSLDTGEVWSCSYAHLLDECRHVPQLLDVFLKSISLDFSQAREQMMTLCSLPTHARVAQFLCTWVEAMQARDLRTDEIALRLSREEIGSHLGMTLESVSRALNQLARTKLIGFVGKRRRAFRIPDIGALRDFIHGSETPDERPGVHRSAQATSPLGFIHPDLRSGTS